jgi:hypothetical protein
MRPSISSLWRRFSRLPSWAIALTYLLLIPVFAVVYFVLPNGFYHTTVQHEPVMDEEAAVLLFRLQEELVSQFEHGHGQPAIDVGVWRLDSRTIRLYDLRPTDTQVAFTVAIRLDGIGLNQGSQMYTSVMTSLDVRSRILTAFPDDRPSVVFMTTQFESDDFPVPLAAMFPTQNLEVHGYMVPGILITEELYSDLMGFANALRGFPSGTRGTFGRMLYVSAVTITTLGYGDVIPLTRGARSAVAIEAILGVVLAGLFINSLFSRRKSQERH